MDDGLRNVFEFDTLDGTRLVVEIEQGGRIDTLSMLIAHDFGDPTGVVTTKFIHLDAYQAVRLAEAIFGRWGGPDEEGYR